MSAWVRVAGNDYCKSPRQLSRGDCVNIFSSSFRLRTSWRRGGCALQCESTIITITPLGPLEARCDAQNSAEGERRGFQFVMPSVMLYTWRKRRRLCTWRSRPASRFLLRFLSGVGQRQESDLKSPKASSRLGLQV